MVFTVANVRPNSVQATPIRFWALKVGLRMELFLWVTVLGLRLFLCWVTILMERFSFFQWPNKVPTSALSAWRLRLFSHDHRPMSELPVRRNLQDRYFGRVDSVPDYLNHSCLLAHDERTMLVSIIRELHGIFAIHRISSANRERFLALQMPSWRLCARDLQLGLSKPVV